MDYGKLQKEKRDGIQGAKIGLKLFSEEIEPFITLTTVEPAVELAKSYDPASEDYVETLRVAFHDDPAKRYQIHKEIVELRLKQCRIDYDENNEKRAFFAWKAIKICEQHSNIIKEYPSWIKTYLSEAAGQIVEYFAAHEPGGAGAKHHRDRVYRALGFTGLGHGGAYGKTKRYDEKRRARIEAKYLARIRKKRKVQKKTNKDS
jgi:hypothetical protein